MEIEFFDLILILYVFGYSYFFVGRVMKIVFKSFFVEGMDRFIVLNYFVVRIWYKLIVVVFLFGYLG